MPVTGLCFASDLVCGKVKDLHSKEEVLPIIRASIMSKQYGNEDFLANLITDACCKSPWQPAKLTLLPMAAHHVNLRWISLDTLTWH